MPLKTYARKSNKKIIVIAFLVILIILYFIYNFSKIQEKQGDLNVLLITIDALRFDHLGCYGYKRNTSPVIDQLARKGILFNQAVSQSFWTMPSLPSLMTSSYPYKHASHNWDNLLNPYLPTLASLLKNKGYATGFINGHDVSNELWALGWAKGFTVKNGNQNGLKADQVTHEALDFINNNKNRKFFLWLHYFDCHESCHPPIPYNTMYVEDRFYDHNKQIPIYGDQLTKYYTRGVISRDIADGNIMNPAYYIARYDGAIRFVDNQIGVLLDRLKEINMDKNTLVIITADHGESLGEHDVYFSHTYFYDTDIRVPLIFKYEKVFSPGQIIDYQVGLIDILPTILSITNTRSKINMEGIDLCPFITKQKNISENRIIFCEEFYKHEFPGKRKIVALRTPEWKLIFHLAKNKYELYDLKNDPGELINVAEIETERLKFFTKKLHQWMDSHQPIKSIVVSTPDAENKLKSLGYLQ